MYIDETVDVLLILRTPYADEHTLKSHLSRLVVSLDARVVNNTATSRDSSPTADTIFTGTVKDVDDPFIVVGGDPGEESDGDEESDQHLYAIWKLPVLLTRPRIRLHSPSVIFSASAGMKPDVAVESAKTTGYLTSGIPSSFNILESFTGDPALHGAKPRLSSLRVSRVAPVTRQEDLMQHIRALQHLELKIFPVIHTRIRFSRPNTTPASSVIIALLEIDFTPHFDCEVSLDDIKLSVPDSVVNSLNDEVGMNLPLSCVSHDHVTFLYRIVPDELDFSPKNATRDLDITIVATVQVIPEVCTPRLSMSWTTVIDFTVPVNPGYGPSTGTGIQRSHRPSQLSITGQANHPLKSPSVTRPDALPSLEAATQTETSLPELGITMTFTGPSAPVYPGDVFSWTIHVVNRAAEQGGRPPRKLALVAMPKRRRNEARVLRPTSKGGRRRGESEIADAVVDENVLHAMQKGSVVDSTDIVCLSADTRVGPMAPGACHVVEMQFLALQEGIVGIDAIRVVDLGSQEHVDIRDLPTMIVEPAAA